MCNDFCFYGKNIINEELGLSFLYCLLFKFLKYRTTTLMVNGFSSYISSKLTNRTEQLEGLGEIKMSESCAS